MGCDVLTKCTDRSSERRFKRFVFSKQYIEKMVKAGDKIELALTFSTLSKVGLAIEDDVLGGIEEIRQQNDKLKRMAHDYRNDLLDQLHQESMQTHALPLALFQELVNIGVVSNHMDFIHQLDALTKEANKLRNDRENLRTNMTSVDESILLSDNSILQMVERLSQNGLNDDNDILKCPISLNRLQDPVTLFPSGRTFDKESICTWLLKKPNQDPLAPGQKIDKLLLFADNISLRQLLMHQHGDAAYVKYDDSKFQEQYLEAQFKLGLTYMNGEGVTKNDKIAVQWYRFAADGGHAAAQCNLGSMYHKGNGVTKNYGTAVEWYRCSAEQGSATAQYNLGVLYEHGCGVEKSRETARKWYQHSADQGHQLGKSALDKLKEKKK
jgi:Sel1 repeat/U-box domain